MPHSDSQGKDSVDLIRDSLFSIQVQQPWLLLQYNSSDIESIGIDRVESLLSTSPDSNNGEDREKIVAEEIEDRSNTNLTITKTINRLGTVFFLFVFNIGISIFVFLLTGIMIFSQVLFIIYAMFLPVSFILSMIPSFDGMSKRAITKLFNTILTRAGITLIITTAFSISTMLYTLSAGYPFFLIAFLQIVKRRSEMEQVKQKKQPASSVHERPTTRQEQYHDEQTSKQSNIQTSYKESQQAKQERPAVKSDFSSPKVERQGNTVQEKTVQKPATSTTTADRTSQRPITKERPSTVQRVPLQNTRSRPPIKTATIKKVGKKP